MALHSKKKDVNKEILEIFKQVKLNIPLLDAIKQIPSYAKFLKNLYIVKRGMNVHKEGFIAKQVSIILQSKSLIKYKDPGYPTIIVSIGQKCTRKVLLDLGVSVNLMLL